MKLFWPVENQKSESVLSIGWPVQKLNFGWITYSSRVHQILPVIFSLPKTQTIMTVPIRPFFLSSNSLLISGCANSWKKLICIFGLWDAQISPSYMFTLAFCNILAGVVFWAQELRAVHVKSPRDSATLIHQTVQWKLQCGADHLIGIGGAVISHYRQSFNFMLKVQCCYIKFFPNKSLYIG